MDETESVDIMTAGQRLREAREAAGLSVEDVAATTRIPTRHLVSLETSDWASLPAATYSIGFAKNYAVVVGLDRTEIGDQIRAELGGSRQAMATAEVFEAADPARTMPKGLVIGTIALLLLVVLGLTWFNNRSLDGDPTADNELVAAVPTATAPATTTGPVVVTANEAVWIEVKDGNAVLKQGELAPGQSYEVPASAAAPTLTTGKPEALRISVGTADAPTVGPAGERVTGVSLRGPDLLRGPAISAPAAAPPSGAVTARRATPSPQPRARAVTPPPPGVEPVANDAAPPPAN